MCKFLSASLAFLLFCVQLGAQENLNLVGHLPYDSSSLAGCWHYVDQEGNEYALVGTSRGLSIVNLNEPTAPYEVFFVPGPINNWREVKTWAGFAYVCSEAATAGITIVDLNYLPDSISYKVWTGDQDHPNSILSAHAVAATDGYLYVFGSKIITNGAVICDLADPWNPVVVGNYNQQYIHDGYVHNDTLYAGEIYAGQFSVVDVRNKTQPQLITNQPTAGLFNHNTWLSNDGRTLYTTDEKPNAPLASFDISDLDNIRLLDKYYPSQEPSKEVHNVRVLNDYLINPSYGGQLTIVDGHRPSNLVEIAWAITGSSLVWDADPYLPSGVVFATAKNEGLFIYEMNYKRAAYLEGEVTDSLSGAPIAGATMRILNTAVVDSTQTLGQYATGYHTPGLWQVEVSHPGYETRLYNQVELLAGEVTELNARLKPLALSGQEIAADAKVRVFPTSFLHGFHIEINHGAAQNYLAELTNLQGQLLYSQKLSADKHWIELGNQFAAGHYLVTIKTDKGVVHTQRLVKQGG